MPNMLLGQAAAALDAPRVLKPVRAAIEFARGAESAFTTRLTVNRRLVLCSVADVLFHNEHMSTRNGLDERASSAFLEAGAAKPSARPYMIPYMPPISR